MKKLFFCLLFLFSSYLSFAQSQIRGKIFDDQGEPASFANVLLFNHFDSAFVKGVISNVEGIFVIDKVVSGNYYVEISMIGFQKIKSQVFYLDDHHPVNLQNFYLEALNACRRENKLAPTYRPQTLLELAEYMAFTERYAKRRIPLPGRQQQLIILRAQTFSQQQPPETCVDIEKAAEGSTNDGDGSWEDPAVQQLRTAMATQPEPEPSEETLRSVVINELISYLEERQQGDCADYFALRLKDLSAQEIEAILGLTSRQRDYLQQRFKYHLIRIR